MGTIDLRTIKTVFICPDHNEKYAARRKHMEAMLARHGFTNVIMYKAGTENYPHCLRYSLYNILQQNLDNPVLILEDDIMFCKDPNFVYDLPSDCDACYFGISGTGMDFTSGKNYNPLKHGSDFEIHDDTFVRIKNMLSAHAILYVGRKYKQHLSKQMLLSGVPCDVEMCAFQPMYNIYGLRLPICWQSKKFNTDDWVEYITKVRFNERGCWLYNEAEEDQD